MRNLLATVPQSAREAIAAIVRTVFAQPDHASALGQLKKVADGLRSRFAQAAALLEDAAEDILAYRHVPVEHQRQLHSTNLTCLGISDHRSLREWRPRRDEGAVKKTRFTEEQMDLA
jgi:transposase-like protein